MCSFYFEGYENSVPVFNMEELFSGTSAQLAARSPTGIPLQLSVANAGVASFTCPNTIGPMENTFQFKDRHLSALGFLFYQVNLPGPQYVTLQVTFAQVMAGGTGSIQNLNPGDGNILIPEATRCVVFQVIPRGNS